jgi:Protein of unknown function (DUF5818)
MYQEEPMKIKLALCAFMLSGSMFVVAQQPSTSPSAGTPPTFPSDQKAPATDQARPDINASPTAAQSGSMDQSSSASAKPTEGCLSQASSGSGFILTDASGVQYTLTGDSSELSSHVGQQVRITGEVAPNATAGMKTDSSDAKGSSAASASTGSGTDANSSSITVKKVKKIASTCSNTQTPSK